MSDVGQRIRQLRTEQKISQNALAKRAGIAQATLNAIEADTKNPSVETVRLLAVALGSTVSELMGEVRNSSSISPRDRQLLAVTQQLNDAGFSRVLSYAEDLVSSGNYEKVKTPAAG